MRDVLMDSPEMTDTELIGYCEIHCTTERALFHSKHINRMAALAGVNEGVPTGWYSMHDLMEQLCVQARARMSALPGDTHA